MGRLAGAGLGGTERKKREESGEEEGFVRSISQSPRQKAIGLDFVSLARDCAQDDRGRWCCPRSKSETGAPGIRDTEGAWMPHRAARTIIRAKKSVHRRSWIVIRGPCSRSSSSTFTTHDSRATALLVLVAGQPEGDRSPEEPRAHLHRQMALVVGVPDPDVAAVLHHACVGGGLHANSFEGAERGLDLFAALPLSW